MRSRLLGILLATCSAAACAPLHPGGYGQPYLRPSPSYLQPQPAASDVAGRWDNVMMLPPQAAVYVLLMDGSRAEGAVLRASATALALSTAAGEIELPADTIARVDRIHRADRVRAALWGAGHGLGAVGVLGLIAGRLPPPRLFAAGGILGAEAGIHGTPSGAATIYVNPQLRR